jgi:hypothetical protein
MLPKSVNLYYNNYEKCWKVEFERINSEEFYQLSLMRAHTILAIMTKMTNVGLCTLEIDLNEYGDVLFSVTIL